MKVTLASIAATRQAASAGRPALTPELLAASGARYSRNNEGLDVILSRIDPADPDRSVDGIFRMIDYGHQSIADMAPIAMFIDGLSIWLAYHVWSLCPTAGGQESSTRYIRLDPSGLPTADSAGIPQSGQEPWAARMAEAFRDYSTALDLWKRILDLYPDLAGIPSEILADPSDVARKKAARMRRNYAFDRARIHLPAAALTNMMLVMSARGWVALCQQLLSHPLPEPRALGAAIREELALAVPRLLKHAVATRSFEEGIADELALLSASARQFAGGSSPEALSEQAPGAFLDLLIPPDIAPMEFADALRHHDNRYAWIGQAARRTAVRFGWKAVGFAEIRDLNRHRTGMKHCPLVPVGFYTALDQIPPDLAGSPEGDGLRRLAERSAARAAKGLERLAAGEYSAFYDYPLGTQFSFEHVTTLDKLIYEAELRTGAGAHYRYAAHLRETLGLLYERLPMLRGLVIEGAAEPE